MTDTMRERLIAKVMTICVLDDSAEPGMIPNRESAEEIVDAILAEMRTPTTEVILAGIETHDSVQWFWPLMIDRLRGAK